MILAFFESVAAAQFWVLKPPETHQLTLFRIRKVSGADRLFDKIRQKLRIQSRQIRLFWTQSPSYSFRIFEKSSGVIYKPAPPQQSFAGSANGTTPVDNKPDSRSRHAVAIVRAGKSGRNSARKVVSSIESLAKIFFCMNSSRVRPLTISIYDCCVSIAQIEDIEGLLFFLPNPYQDHKPTLAPAEK